MNIDRRNTINPALIKEVTDRIVEVFHPERVILFGSHASGSAGPDSDLDLLVVMNTSLPFYQRIPRVSEIFGSRQWPMDLLVFTPQEFAEQKNVNGTIIELAVREGKELYAR